MHASIVFQTNLYFSRAIMILFQNHYIIKDGLTTTDRLSKYFNTNVNVRQFVNHLETINHANIPSQPIRMYGYRYFRKRDTGEVIFKLQACGDFEMIGNRMVIVKSC